MDTFGPQLKRPKRKLPTKWLIRAGFVVWLIVVGWIVVRNLDRPGGTPAGQVPDQTQKVKKATYTERGQQALGEGDHKEAATLFRRALLKNKDDIEALRGLAAVLFVSKKYDDAAAEFERLAKLQPDDPQVVVRLAQSYEQVGKPEQAEKILESFLATHPDAQQVKAHLNKK